jgi:histidinol dehydrogenase
MSLVARFASDDSDFEERFAALVGGDSQHDGAVEQTVRDIIDRVRREGDVALLEYTQRFDGLQPGSAAELQVPAERLRAAHAELPALSREALDFAARRIHDYHRRQTVQSWSYKDDDGTVLGQRVTPLDRVGVYVPGGKAAYPSSVLMNVIPAKVAGVPQVLMVVPARAGEIHPMVLAAAHMAGVDGVFTVGGAQAVAALAFGTETVPRVDKIVGPGNAYVAEAKRQLFGVVGIDMIAGPSEILILCDGTTSAEWIAMDLFSQAEHDREARAVLLCPSAEFIAQVAATMDRLLPGMERHHIIRESLAAHGALIRVRDLDEGVELANRIAPEHLELSVAEPEELLDKVRHAGAVFLGRYSAEAMGDYCAGPNHVLPTASGAVGLAPTVAILAYGEGLTAHARSAELRLDEESPPAKKGGEEG